MIMPAPFPTTKLLTPAAKYAGTCARVSSKDQEKEGFSIPAQQRLLRDHADSNGVIIRQEFVDVETARRSGRTAFGELLSYVRRHPRTIILVEKTDRLYRNIKGLGDP